MRGCFFCVYTFRMQSSIGRQRTSTVLMVRPVTFGANPETALSNTFQRLVVADATLVQQALQQFEALRAVLDEAGVRVIVAEGRDDPFLPDQVFPNNWLSLHEEGTAVLYPMQAPSRRAERRRDVFELLAAAGVFNLRRLIDLTHYEAQGRFLEGTGSLVLDRAQRIAYACRSPRTDAQVAADACLQLGYRLIVFDAVDASGMPVYHTNVLLALGTGFAVLCSEAIEDDAERRRVQAAIAASGREIITASRAQMGRFMCNLLELEAADGSAVIALSAAAEAALQPEQRARLASYGRLATAAIPDIEAAGGGSVRCMLAEVFS